MSKHNAVLGLDEEMLASENLTKREGNSRATQFSISPWAMSYLGEMTPHLLSLYKSSQLESTLHWPKVHTARVLWRWL